MQEINNLKNGIIQLESEITQLENKSKELERELARIIKLLQSV